MLIILIISLVISLPLALYVYEQGGYEDSLIALIILGTPWVLYYSIILLIIHHYTGEYLMDRAIYIAVGIPATLIIVVGMVNLWMQRQGK